MKFNYVSKESKAIHLGDLESGTVFRPKNSQELYMVCDYTAEDEIFDSETAKNWIQNIQNFDFDDVPPTEEEIHCGIHIRSGSLEFFHKNIVVIPLEAELTVVEDEA